MVEKMPQTDKDDQREEGKFTPINQCHYKLFIGNQLCVKSHSTIWKILQLRISVVIIRSQALKVYITKSG